MMNGPNTDSQMASFEQYTQNELNSHIFLICSHMTQKFSYVSHMSLKILICKRYETTMYHMRTYEKDMRTPLNVHVIS